MHSNFVSDVSKLALCEDEVTWENILKPNIRHILASILRGTEYLHSKGLQHCDLKGVLNDIMHYDVITPRACARGKAISFVCRLSSAQKSPGLEF